MFGVPSSSIIARSSAGLVGGVEPAHRLGQLAVHVRHRPRHALAAPRVAAVAQLDRLELAGGGARRHGRAAGRAGLQQHVDLDGRVAAAVEDLPRVHLLDLAQASVHLVSESVRRAAQRQLRVDARLDGRLRPRPAAARPAIVARTASQLVPRALARACRTFFAYSVEGSVSGSVAEDLAAALLVALDLVPVAHHVARGSASVAAAIGAPPNTCGWRRISFARQCSATSARLPGAALLQQQREEVDLEQHVAELVEQLGVVARLGGVGQLVGLLDRVRDDRALVLLAVPGALAAQPPGDLVEPQERGRRDRRPLLLGDGLLGVRRRLGGLWLAAAGCRPRRDRCRSSSFGAFSHSATR